MTLYLKLVVFLVFAAVTVQCNSGSGLMPEDDIFNGSVSILDLQSIESTAIGSFTSTITLQPFSSPTTSAVKYSTYLASSSSMHFEISNGAIEMLSTQTYFQPAATPTDIEPSQSYQAAEASTQIAISSTQVVTNTTNGLFTSKNEGANTQVPSAGVPAGALAGIVIALIVTVAALVLASALLICLCCCCLKAKKYEYSTGNANRMPLHPWNVTSAQWINRSHSVSSFGSSFSRGSRGSGWSKGSGLFGSLGFMKAYNGSTDQVTSIVNQSIPDLYSTPL